MFPYFQFSILNSQLIMNWLDIVILILCGLGLIKGLHDGMVKQLVAVVALIIGIYLCSGVGKWLYGYLFQMDLFPQKGVLWISYLLGFALIVGVIMLAGNIVNRLINATPLSILNHLIGGVAGLVLMVLFISVILTLIEVFDTQSVIIPHDIKTGSHFYSLIKSILLDVFPGNLFDLKIDTLVTWMCRIT